jgi:hypothetical protein
VKEAESTHMTSDHCLIHAQQLIARLRLTNTSKQQARFATQCTLMQRMLQATGFCIGIVVCVTSKHMQQQAVAVLYMMQ